MFFKVVDLTKRFGGLTAVSGVSFSVERGEIVGVFGPNGSGKTTLLNVIAGIYQPSSGQIRWKEQALNGAKPHQIAAAGIVKTFQNPQLFEELTVIEHVMIASHLKLKRLLGFARIRTLLGSDRHDGTLRAHAERVLELCRLQELRSDPAASLSYGGEKMLGVAMAMMCEPELLLLDEPATGLGGDEIRNLAEVLRDLRAQGTTLCIIDHQIQFLRRLADRAIALHHGGKIAEGAPDAVLNDPRVVSAYLGRSRA